MVVLREIKAIVNGYDTVRLRQFTVSIRYKTADRIVLVKLEKSGQIRTVYRTDTIRCVFRRQIILCKYRHFRTVIGAVLIDLGTCKPKLVANQSFASDNPIDIIGFVGQPPLMFNLILQMNYTVYKPLLTIYAIQGKTPADFLRTSRFMNCTGNLNRITDSRKIYIDTPSIYGFSGGPCFLQSNEDYYFFGGLLIGMTRIWNGCILLANLSAFKEYNNTLIEDSNQMSSLKTDL